jgi:HPt (histidine-containing phosphotransfer) domain-containing protein
MRRPVERADASHTMRDKLFELSADPASSAPTAATLDLSTILSLRAVLPASAREQLVELLVTGTSETVAVMREARVRGDEVALREAAHRCKGGSMMLGAVRMGEICARLERLAERHEFAAGDAEIDSLVVAADDAALALRRQLLGP